MRSMQEDLQIFGQRFRQRREERNLSLKEVENSTSIRMGHLEAIEEGRFSNLISPVYAQGFIKKYASFLELDGDQMMIEHPQVEEYLNQKKNGEYTFLGSIEVRGSPAADVKWVSSVLWVGGSMFAILTLWFLARSLGFF
ncbi:MAG: hypothetical protein S4CHLAM45_14310 [Chlamydiales bacterium]|nr:hypothetical protein [Chlamydiales bacterium]MCH9620060.1 hypothetical protein [Chlamydiales bacterium]MCH9623521.1 hypothetical protein [Chlamydiales bacterium]